MNVVHVVIRIFGRACTLVGLVGLIANVLLPHVAYADITVTGTVDANDVPGGGSTPVTSGTADQTFGPEIEINLNTGQVVVDNGSILVAGATTFNDTSTLIVTGAGSRIDLIGNLVDNKLDVRGPGNSFQILSGGVVNATDASCTVCNFIVANFPGSDMDFFVDGAGSQLNTIHPLTIALGNTDFGIIGADSIATFSVLNGGLVNSDSTTVSGGLFGSNIQPGQFTDATVNISGASQWTSNIFDVASGLNAMGTLNISGGSVLDTDLFRAANDATAVANITVTGPSSAILVTNNMVIGRLGTANLLASNGAVIAVANDIVLGGQAGSSGTMSIDGPGSFLTASNLLVGSSGDGALNITNGAFAFLVGNANSNDVAFLGIANNQGSTGDLSIDGAGSQVSVVGTNFGVVAVGNDFLDVAGAGTGSLNISNGGSMLVAGSTGPGLSEVFVGFGREGTMQVDTAGVLSVDGFLIVGEGATGTVNILSGGSVILSDLTGAGPDVAEIGLEIGLSREADNLDGAGTVTVSGAGSSLSVVGGDAFIDIAFSNSLEQGSGNAFGQLNIINGASLLLQADATEFGGLVLGVGGGSTGEFNITGANSNVSISGRRGVLLVASDIQEAVGGAQGSLLVDAGASLNVFGAEPGSSFVAIGMGLGDATAIISGGSTFDIDGDLFVSVSNADALALFPEITDEPLSGNAAQTGQMLISGAAQVTTLRTTIGDRGTLQIQTGGSLTTGGGLLIAEGGTSVLEVTSGGQLQVLESTGDEAFIIVARSRLGSNQDAFGTMNISGVGTSVVVQGTEAAIDVGLASHDNAGTGIGNGALNVTAGASLIIDGNDGFGGLFAGIGGNATGAIVISDPGTSVLLTGDIGLVMIASDLDDGVAGTANGSLLVTNGAALVVTGTTADSSIFGIGVGLGAGTATVSGGATVAVDGDIYVSADNATILSLLGEPTTGNASQTGVLNIFDTAQVSALRTTIGARGILGGTGALVSDAFVEIGGALELSGSITGNVFNAGGTVDPGGAGAVGGTLSIDGDYIQSDGLVRFSIAGTQAGEFDQLDASGDISLLGGAVELDFVNGFSAQQAQDLPLLQAGGSLNIDPSVAFNVGTGQPAFSFVPVEVFITDPTTGLQVAKQQGTFNLLESNLAEILPPAQLSGNEGSLVAALDDICTASGSIDPSSDEADLLQVCADIRNAGNTPEQLMQVLSALGTDEVTQTTNSALLFTIPQHGNLSQRINGVRAGANPFDFSGLNLVYGDHQIASEDLERFVKGLLGLAAGDADEFAKWGVFGNGNINFGDKDATDNGGGFDYDTMTITMGADYRARDNLIFGGTLSYSSVNADFEEGGGMDLDSWAGSAFGTFFLKDKFYFDLLGTYGQNDIKVRRHISYSTAMGTVNRRADSDTDGEQYSFSFGTGYDFTPNAWVFGPHAGVNYTELETDKYTETGAQGLNLTVQRQTATSLTSNLGLHVSYTFTPEWGVITPYLRADWVHEFEDDAEIIEVGFANDPLRNDPTNPTQPILVATDERDTDYFVYSAGFSVQLIRGVAGFMNYRTTQDLEDLSLTDITWGLRFEREW